MHCEPKDVRVVEPSSSRSVIFSEGELSVDVSVKDEPVPEAELVYNEAFGVKIAEARPAEP